MSHDDTFFPGLSTRELTPFIYWRFYKHWGQGYAAGEGLKHIGGDRSGCLDDDGRTDRPFVVQARLYESLKGKVSAVYSYPNGLGAVDHYFWEIMPIEGELDHEVERFDTEGPMERRIIELLG
jgi:hypothetical protein